MDPRRFDSLTRSLVAPRSRRGLLGALAALGAGLLGGRGADAQVTQAQCGNKVCASNSGVCTNGCDCCVYPNGNSRCRPPGECSGTVVSPTTTPAPTATTLAPTTTTTTAPTTTLHPIEKQPTQGTCPAAAHGCGSVTTCNGRTDCSCFQTVTGAIVCGDHVNGRCSPSPGISVSCNTDADCSAVTGSGSVCVTGCQGCLEHNETGKACVPPCPA